MIQREWPSTKYLGGIPSLARPLQCDLRIREAGLELHYRNGSAMLRFEHIRDIEVCPFIEYSRPGNAKLGKQAPKQTFKEQWNKNEYVVVIHAEEAGIGFRCGFIPPAGFRKRAVADNLLAAVQEARVMCAQQPRSTHIGAEEGACTSDQSRPEGDAKNVEMYNHVKRRGAQKNFAGGLAVSVLAIPPLLLIAYLAIVAKPPASESPSARSQLSHSANPFDPGRRLRFDEARADRGKDLFREVIAEYPMLDPFYTSVDQRSVPSGFAAVMVLPEVAWERLGEEDKVDLGNFMSRESPETGWVIYVGAIQASDITVDKTGLSSRTWKGRQGKSGREDSEAEESGNWRAAIVQGPRGRQTGVAAMLLYAEARDLVRRGLKNPRGARFAPFNNSAVYVERLWDGDVRVVGWVDASNSFGATIRTRWEATIRPVGGQRWTLVDLDTSP